MVDGWQSYILSTHDQAWNNFVNISDFQDIFYFAEYHHLFEQATGNEGVMIVHGNADEFIAYPFFLQDLSRLPWFSREEFGDPAYFDIISPWYYGGYLFRFRESTDCGALFREFYHMFSGYCREKNIISEFGRFHPFIDTTCLSDPSMNTRTAGSVVYIDLSQDSDVIWDNLARSNRKKIKKCLKNNVEVSFSKDPEDIRIFSQLYSRLMEERNAKMFYKFSLDFFDNLSLNLHDGMELLLAYYDNTVIAGLLLLGHNQYIHTFLSASVPEYRDLGANNLLKYKGALRAKEMGYRYYLLGGGYGDTGGLLDFKKTFSSTTRDFRVYYKVWDEQTYHRLSEKNDSYNLQMGFHKNKDDFFFPEYRR